MISRTLVTIYENRDFAKTPPCFTISNQKKSRMSNIYDFKLSCYNNLKENCRHLSTISTYGTGMSVFAV